MGFLPRYEEEDRQGRFRVQTVTPGSPAEQAGLLPDDVVVAVNGVGFRFATELEIAKAFDWLEPGDRLELTVLRAGRPLTLELVATEMAAETAEQWQKYRTSLEAQAVPVQRGTLFQLGRGEGIEIKVAKDASGELRFTAPGHPPQVFAHLEETLRVMPPAAGLLDALLPGDHFTLRVETEGNRLNLKVENVPPYLVDGAALGPP